MSALDLFELARRIERTRIAAQQIEADERQSLHAPHNSSVELLGCYRGIELACQTQNQCDAALAGLEAIVGLVAAGANAPEEL